MQCKGKQIFVTRKLFCRFFALRFEKGELNTAVTSLLIEFWMVRKIFLRRVFQNKNPIFTHKTTSQNQARQLLHPLHIVRRVGKDDIKRIASCHTLQIDKYIRLDALNLRKTKFTRCIRYKSLMERIHFDRHHPMGPSRSKFVAYRPRPGEEVQYIDRLQVVEILEYIKKVLLGKVGRGPCSEITRRNDLPPTSDTSYNAHISRTR